MSAATTADTSGQEQALQREREGRVAWLLLNRPKRCNALTPALVEALSDALVELDGDAEVRAVVLGGRGGAFCAGADLRDMMADEDLMARVDRGLDSYHRLIRTLVGLSKPVVAMVDGPAVGFGCDLALACDMRVLSERAYLQEKFVRIGLMPDGGGTLWLPRLIGVGPALEAMMLGDAISADRAAQLGLANRVVAAEALRDAAAQLAGRLANGPPLALAAIKRAVRAGAEQLDATLKREREGQKRLLGSEDFREGVTAWMEKRDPMFSGR